MKNILVARMYFTFTKNLRNRMKVAVIQASSQSSKNQLIYDSVKQFAKGAEVLNFGCLPDEEEKYSYIEISLLAGLLLWTEAVDFVVTGCSSGQGMMLACNSIPGVLCGYVPTPKDAYLFAQINNGNAVSLPLGEEYTYGGEENLRRTIEALFSEPFGQGWPKPEAERKKADTLLLKELRSKSQIQAYDFFAALYNKLRQKIMTKKNVIDYIPTVEEEKWKRKILEIM